MTGAPAPGGDRAPVAKRTARLMFAVRYVIPALVVLGGLVVMALGSEADVEGGAGIVSAGLAVYAMNWLYRASVNGDRERDAEEAARDYLDLHGHWPDEPAPRTPAKRRSPPAPPRLPPATRRPQH